LNSSEKEGEWKRCKDDVVGGIGSMGFGEEFAAELLVAGYEGRKGCARGGVMLGERGCGDENEGEERAEHAHGIGSSVHGGSDGRRFP
jgi:hypothetical protein